MDIIGIVGVAAGSISIPLAAVATATSVMGISQGVNSSQGGGGGGGGGGEPDKDDPRVPKFNVYTECAEPSSPAKNLVHNKIVVLREKKLYLDAADPDYRVFSDGHPFSGFYIEYPWAEKPLALVSTIKPDPPELNWIYVDRDSLAVTYGNKTASIDQIHGPWDWTDDQSSVTLEGWEGFVAVEESPGVFYLAYDQDEDHLKELGVKGRVVDVNLKRVLEPKKQS
ncbi:hypothetical protein DFP72DRAFT_1102381 [Ephemerocybe angulata]|uniref:Uncharacterized protein n=1 Tax=Ephemerocybe angulata TaxID=980116 RepID=A0A8H6I5A1_9AGAR|nr:hypothetical protein DFP72DRAFT_1102381 [Tulosesus angulatus]